MKHFKSVCILLSAIFICLAVPCTSAADEYSGVHPRLLFSAEEFNAMKQKSQGKMSGIYSALLASCNTLVQNGVTEYYVDSNSEDLWMRTVGDNILKLAFAYKLSGNADYFAAAAANVETAAAYPTWGRGTAFENKDLAAAHLLVGISCYYDWLFDDLSAAQKKTALDTLYYHGNILKDCRAWWNRSYLQNHMWICLTAVMMSSIAIRDEYPESDGWLEQVNNLYSTVFRYLSRDGATQEGHMYWNYGTEFLIYYIKTAKKFCNIDYTQNEYVKNAQYYGVYMLAPRVKTSGKVTDVFDFSDSSTNNGNSFIPTIAYFASNSRNAQTQWFVDYLWQTTGNEADMWKMLMYYDETLIPQTPDASCYPTDKLFGEMGYAFLRSGWADNEDAIALKCGKCLGTATPQNYSHSDIGTGHVHPDVNHFVINANGQRLLTDDGYARAYTCSHNTLSINGAGQYGEGNYWKLPESTDAAPEIKRFVSENGYAYIACDGTPSYTPEVGLKKFVRHFLYVKDAQLLIVTDDVEMASKTAGDKTELRFFSGINYKKTLDNGAFLFDNNIVSFKINPFASENEKSLQTIDRVYNKAGNTRPAAAVCVSSQSGRMLQSTAFSWKSKGKQLSEAEQISQSDAAAQFIVTDNENGGKQTEYTIDLANMTVNCREILPFGVSVDYENSTVELSGRLPKGVYNKLALKLEDENGSIKYVGQLTTPSPDYSCKMALSQISAGTYKMSVANDEYGTVLQKSFTVDKSSLQLTVKNYSITNAATVNAAAELENLTSKSRGVWLMLAVYNETGALAAVSASRDTLAAGESKSYSVSAQNPGNFQNVKFMIWDGDAFSPLISIK